MIKLILFRRIIFYEIVILLVYKFTYNVVIVNLVKYEYTIVPQQINYKYFLSDITSKNIANCQVNFDKYLLDIDFSQRWTCTFLLYTKILNIGTRHPSINVFDLWFK